ncbi:MAG: MBL fold metallo-hydrolase [Verrucomicrobiae bacterium]|nr:MBL fold metallo-hydrolase [Verrucomicrobiae bacterium]
MASARPQSSTTDQSRPEIPVEARDRGIYLPEAELWLDPSRVKPVAFVSHAHSDHFARHHRILCSPATGDVLKARYGQKTACDPVAFGQSIEHNGHSIELFPAGHALGSAQIRIERLSDGASLLYTGDFKRRPSLTCEPYEARTADTLIMETTFGLPKFRFPAIEDVRADVLRFCRETLDAGEVPMLLGYSFGKAQELLAILTGSGLEAMVHDSIRKLLPTFESHGFAFPPWQVFDPGGIDGKVLVFPPTAERKAALAEIKRPCRTAVATGWAIDPRARYRYRADAAFPLSDHADWPDLLRCAQEVQPSRILTTHGYAAPFAADLRRRGFNAWSLHGIDQMELSLGLDEPEA